jgi:hypothetical protein
VVGTALDGTTYQKSITVFGQPDTSYIELISNLESGISPLTVTLNAETFLSSPVASSNLAYAGPATAAVAFVSNTQYNVTMNTEGLYVFTLYITDTQGRTYQDSVAVNVLSLTAIDTLLKSKWEGMKAALQSGDIETALGYFTPEAKEKYRYVFQALQPNLSTIVDSLQSIRLVEVQQDVVECFTNRIEDGILNAYFVYFSRDPNGLWKLSAM